MTFVPHTAIPPWLRPVGLAAALALVSLDGATLAPAHAQPTMFTGAALVPLQGESDVVKARSLALTEALARAVEQAVAEVMPEARSRVYLVSGRARDFVTTYRVLQEGEVAGQFQLRIEAQLDLPRLQRELLGTAGAAASPSTLYLCSAQTTEAARSALDAARTQLLESSGAVEILPAEQCTDAPDLRALRGAVALLSLSASTSTPEPIRGTQPAQYGAQGRSEWRLLRIGHEPLTESAEAAGFGPDPTAAAAESQRHAARTGLNHILVRSGPLQRRSERVLVRVENLGSFRAYQQVARVLSSLPGVTRVEPHRFYIPASGTGTEDSVAQLLLSTSTSVETLGATLGRTPIPGLRLQVVPVHASELRVVCVASDALPSATQPSEPSDPSEAEKLP